MLNVISPYLGDKCGLDLIVSLMMSTCLAKRVGVAGDVIYTTFYITTRPKRNNKDRPR